MKLLGFKVENYVELMWYDIVFYFLFIEVFRTTYIRDYSGHGYAPTLMRVFGIRVWGK